MLPTAASPPASLAPSLFLSAAQRSAMLALATTERMRARGVIVAPGAALDRLWYVMSGDAVVRSHRPAGQRPGRRIAVIPAGCFFGETGVFSGPARRAQSWVQAGLHGGRFAWWPLDIVLERFVTDAALAAPLLLCLGGQMALRMRSLVLEAGGGGMRPGQRIAAALALAARRDGQRCDGQLVVRIDATALAAVARCAPATVRRLLSAWRAQGVIGGRGREHILDERFFLRLATPDGHLSEACLSGLPTKQDR